MKLQPTLILLVSALPALAQTATVNGVVADSSQAVISGANVSITNLETGLRRETRTNETGNYTFPLVPVGDYTIRCEMQGFKSEVVRNLRLETAAQLGARALRVTLRKVHADDAAIAPRDSAASHRRVEKRKLYGHLWSPSMDRRSARELSRNRACKPRPDSCVFRGLFGSVKGARNP